MEFYDEYFTDSDKPYAENLNDGLLLIDAFNVTVPVVLPDMFRNSEFSASLNTPRKAGVGIVTLVNADSGVEIGVNTIRGSGEVVYRVYPNFNEFYKWERILLSKTGNVSISFRDIEGNPISASVGADGFISDNSALKTLQEIDVVLTLNHATINKILIYFVNDHDKSERTGALLEADQLVNVNGTVTANDDRVVSGDTVKRALDSLDDSIHDDITELSESIDTKLDNLDGDVDSKLDTLEDAIDTKLNLKEDFNYEVDL